MSKKKIPNENTQDQNIDPTEARRERCYPIVKAMLQMMVDDELLLSDKTYIEQQLKGQLEIAFRNIVIDHFNTIFEVLYQSLQMTLKQAQDTLWDKDSDELTYKDLDDLFKKEQEKLLQKKDK